MGHREVFADGFQPLGFSIQTYLAISLTSFQEDARQRTEQHRLTRGHSEREVIRDPTGDLTNCYYPAKEYDHPSVEHELARYFARYC